MQWFLSIFVALALVACGGGGGSGAAGGGGANNGTGSAGNAGNVIAVRGVAAVGAAINGRVYLLDASGNERYVDSTDGYFNFNLAGVKAPVLLKVQWNDSTGSHRLYSFASADGIANISPLTDFVVAVAAGGGSPDALYTAPNASAFAAMQSKLPEAIALLQTYLQPFLVRYAVTGADPITYGFVPNHTGMDALLDNISISYSAGNVTLIDKTTQATLLAAPVANLPLAVTSAKWGPADALRATETDVARDHSGQGLVLWTERVNGSHWIKARRMNSAEPGVTLSTAGDAAAPRLAVDGKGNALAVWTQYSNARNSVWASHYTASLNLWDAPRMVSSAAAVANAELPDLSLDLAGNAIAVWQQGDGRNIHSDGWAARYRADSGSWSAPAMVSDGLNSAHSLRVAVNASGQGLLAWEQERGDGSDSISQPTDIWVRMFSTSAGWASPTLVNASAGKANTAYVYGTLALDVNAKGHAAVLWSQRALPSKPMVVAAALYNPAKGWQDAASIVLATTEDCYDPVVALDDAGNALAVWQQQTDYGAYGGSNRYVAGLGWGTPGHFVDSRLGDAFLPSLAMDGAGNATVVWYRWSGANAIDLMVNRFTPDSGWANATVFAPVGTSDSMVRPLPHVVANAAGQTLVVWGATLSAVASWL